MRVAYNSCILGESDPEKTLDMGEKAVTNVFNLIKKRKSKLTTTTRPSRQEKTPSHSPSPSSSSSPTYSSSSSSLLLRPASTSSSSPSTPPKPTTPTFTIGKATPTPTKTKRAPPAKPQHRQCALRPEDSSSNEEKNVSTAEKLQPILSSDRRDQAIGHHLTAAKMEESGRSSEAGDDGRGEWMVTGPRKTGREESPRCSPEMGRRTRSRPPARKQQEQGPKRRRPRWSPQGSRSRSSLGASSQPTRFLEKLRKSTATGTSRSNTCQPGRTLSLLRTRAPLLPLRG
ncbi:uncharacterized protein LOC143018530 isoform X2 [Oratosquilla oratoria]|uniref:uncharacterized protein LOC143018530 isoform X2 n=1 Tax=Oratosquilla oratoria TaxID=337810 RepID=UPI003F770E26